MNNNYHQKHSYYCDDHKMLSKEDEKLAFIKYHTATTPELKLKWRNHIITHNTKFAIKCAMQYVRKYPHVDPDDIKGYAVEGLITAIPKYEDEHNTRFTSFAVWWIKATINTNVMENESMIRYPSNQHLDLQRAINEQAKTSIPIDHRFKTMVNTVRGGTSLSTPINNEDEHTLESVIEDTRIKHVCDVMNRDTLNTYIKSVVYTLSDKERYIISELYGLFTGESRSCRDIAEELNIKTDRVRYIKDKSLLKLAPKLAGYSMSDLECT